MSQTLEVSAKISSPVARPDRRPTLQVDGNRRTGSGRDVPTILIVDDDRTCREYLLALLGRRGYRLLEADDGVAVWASASPATPNLIITDILMPSMDGYEFVRQ